jgi:hypothetical protein
MKMNPRLSQMCVSVVKELISHPCGFCFAEPEAGLSTEGSKPYTEVITCPIDLNLILTRLVSNEYKIVDLWERDVGMVWYNAEKYWSRNSYNFILAQELSRQFRKLRRQFDLETCAGWTRTWIRLEKRVNHLLANPPKVTKGYLASFAATREQDVFPEDEYVALLKALPRLTKSDDLLFFNNVLMAYTPKINYVEDPLFVDLRELPVPALVALRDYAVKKFAEKGRPYPTVSAEPPKPALGN